MSDSGEVAEGTIIREAGIGMRDTTERPERCSRRTMKLVGTDPVVIKSYDDRLILNIFI